MIVCSCNVLTDANIKSALDSAAGTSLRTPTAVYKCLGCSPNCGRCFKTIRKIIDETVGARHVHPHAHAHPTHHVHSHPHAHHDHEPHPHAGACDANCANACRGGEPELASTDLLIALNGEPTVIIHAAE